jgi:HAE1 family hydrophobic/amphiphilic exporter-1
MNNKKTIWEFFISRYRFTFLLLFFFAVFGLISVIQIPKESNPEVEIPYAVVVSVYPGANAGDMEELVTQPLEEKIKSIDDVRELTSSSKNSLSTIIVQFDANSDAQEKMNDLKDKVDAAKGELPDDMDEPTVKQISLDDSPVLTFSVSGPYESTEIKIYADEIKDVVEGVSGVSSVEIIGGQNKEIKVIIDKAKLDGYNLSLSQVVQAISAANSDIPVGSIESSNIDYTVRFAGRLSELEDVQAIPLTNLSDSVILLRDVADVYEGYSELETISRLSKSGDPAQNAISLSVYKTVGADTTRLVDEVFRVLDKEKENYPQNLSFDVSKNSGQDIKNDLSNLLVNGLETVLIVVVLLFLFLGWREALLTGLSVPMTFLMSFIFLQACGYTLNFLTLFSLILSLGILVDNAIVIAEGIYVNMSKGLPAKEACVSAVREFQWTLIAGTMTTVFAFLPLISVSGIIGKFMVSIPVTISAVLLSSLFVALALIPAIASLVFKGKTSIEAADKKNQPENKLSRKDRIINNIIVKYDNFIESLLSDKKKSNKILIGVTAAFILSALLPVTGLLKADMFPAGGESKVYMDFKTPFGTPLENTNIKIKEVEDLLMREKGVDSFLVSIGSQTGGGGIVGGGSSGDGNLAGIVVNLNKKYKGSSKEFIKDYNKKLKDVGGLNYELTQDVMGPPSSDPIFISVQGDDLDILDDLAIRIKNIVKNIPGTRSVRFTSDDSPGEIVIEIDRAKAQMYGVTTSQIASVLRVAVAGVDATVLRNDGEETNVLVKYDLDGQNDGISNKKIDLNNIESITILTSQGDIPLSSFVKTKIDYSRSLIEHDGGNRIVSIVGDIDEGVSSQEVFDEAKKEIKKMDIPDGYKVIYGGESEDMEESFTDIFKALIIGIILIAALLVLQFNSFKQALFILVTIPLSLIGVFFGLFISGQPISFPGAIGIVALVGIVVKNAIILVEKINMNIKDGLSLKEAVIDAGKSRLRPIILTTITTVVGMVPLAFSDPTWGPLGFAIIFGLSFSTVLTLFVLPIICYRFSQDKE